MKVFAQRPELSTAKWYWVDTSLDGMFSGSTCQVSTVEYLRDGEYTCCNCGGELDTLLDVGDTTNPFEEKRREARALCYTCGREEKDDDRC